MRETQQRRGGKKKKNKKRSSSKVRQAFEDVKDNVSEALQNPSEKWPWLIGAGAAIVLALVILRAFKDRMVEAIATEIRKKERL